MTRRLLAPSMADLFTARQALSRLKEIFGEIESVGPHLAMIVLLLDQIRLI
jgi:hypothetical protein